MLAEVVGTRKCPAASPPCAETFEGGDSRRVTLEGWGQGWPWSTVQPLSLGTLRQGTPSGSVAVCVCARLSACEKLGSLLTWEGGPAGDCSVAL